MQKKETFPLFISRIFHYMEGITFFPTILRICREDTTTGIVGKKNGQLPPVTPQIPPHRYPHAGKVLQKFVPGGGGIILNPMFPLIQGIITPEGCFGHIWHNYICSGKKCLLPAARMQYLECCGCRNVH